MGKVNKIMLLELLEISQKIGKVLRSPKFNTNRLKELNSEFKGLILSEIYKKEISLVAKLEKKEV